MKNILNTPVRSDVFDFIERLDDNCIQSCICSPPYYGLRNYKIPDRIWDGDPNCDHQWEGEFAPQTKGGLVGYEDPKWNAVVEKMEKVGYSQFCRKCYAWKGTLGSEPFPGLYIQHLTSVFVEMLPKLHDTSTLWVNIADSYAGSGGSWGITREGEVNLHHKRDTRNPSTKGPSMDYFTPLGFKKKDLMGIPWGFAFAMRDAGFYLRQDIIWDKVSPMPEPVKDRCTSSHEYIFLFSKNYKYFYDHYAIMERLNSPSLARGPAFGGTTKDGTGNPKYSGNEYDAASLPGRNKRDVWHFAPRTKLPKELQGQHFAAFPEDLPHDCILAGTPHKCCASCRAPYRRVVEKVGNGEVTQWKQNENWEEMVDKKEDIVGSRKDVGGGGDIYPQESVYYKPGASSFEPWEKTLDEKGIGTKESRTARKRHGADTKKDKMSKIPTSSEYSLACKCGSSETTNAIVFDPFLGTGTTAVVAEKLGRDWVGCDVAERFVDLAKKRLKIQVRKGERIEQGEWW